MARGVVKEMDVWYQVYITDGWCYRGTVGTKDDPLQAEQVQKRPQKAKEAMPVRNSAALSSHC